MDQDPNTARLAANRRNALKSTGPRTAAGKKRSSKNALRHGLSVQIFLTPEETQINSELVRAFRAATGQAFLANAAAEAHLHLIRVRQARLELLNKACDHTQEQRHTEPEELVYHALGSVSSELLKLDGYERKALSRRKNALRALLEANIER